MHKRFLDQQLDPRFPFSWVDCPNHWASSFFFFLFPSKSLILFVWSHALERKCGTLHIPCPVVVHGPLMKARDDRLKSHRSQALELLSQQLSQASTVQRIASLASPEQKPLNLAWDGALLRVGCPVLEQRLFEVFFAIDMRPCNDSIPSGANPKSLFDWWKETVWNPLS